MKYFLTLLGVAALVALVFAFRGVKTVVDETVDKLENVGEKNSLFSKGVKGDGQLVDSLREVGAFTKIASGNAIHVELTKGEEQKVIVRTDSNLQEYIETKVENGELKIYIKKVSIRKNTEMTVFVSFTDLEGLDSSSASSISCEDKIEATDFYVDASSASKVKLKELVAKNVKIDISSAANVRLVGACDYLKVDASSASDASLQELEAKKASVDASSASDVEIMVVEELEANASSGADITYKGTPKILDIEETSGGDIAKH